MFNATGPSTGDAAQPPAATMLQMIAGFWIARAVWAAAELGLADLLPAPRSIDDLARDTGTQPDALYRLMRALASVGVFRELDDRRFESTPLADTLRSDSPDSVRALARSELGHGHYAAWGEILYSLRTGKPSFDHVFGMPVFEWFGKHPERSAVFNQSMSELTRTVEPAVLEAYDFSACGTIVDVGGCFGSLLIAILTKHPALRGVVFDAPDVAAAAQAKIHAAGLSDRLAAVGGDFFQDVPGGGDTYLMKHIIHDWTDAQCVTLLRHCRDVMKAGGILLILDQVLPGPNEASLGKFSDLIMLQLPGGRERTAGEFERLLNDSGFDLARIVATRSPVSIIEGVRR
ncbi:MAG: methyltransferase [Tepidisphaeraceae bacterium]